VSAALLLAAALAAPSPPPQLLAVRMATQQGRPAVQLVSSAPLGEVGFSRDGAQIVLSFQAQAAPTLAQPAVAPPVESARLARRGDELELRLTVAADVPYSMRREGAVLLLVFDQREPDAAPSPARAAAPPPLAPPRPAAPEVVAPPPPTPVASAAPPPVPAPAPSSAPPAAPPAAPLPTPAAADGPSPAAAGDLSSLYGSLFPTPGAEGGAPEAPLAEASSGSSGAAEQDGLALGPAVLRPSVDLLYVDGSGTLLLDQSVNEDSYFEMRPHVRADLPLGNGSLSGDYEARLRAGADIPEVRHSTHLLNANLSYPLGQLVTVRAREHYARGTLEATEVDPGREYFFRLARFRRNSLSAGVQVETAARLKIDLGGIFDTVKVDQEAGFFDYEQRSGQAGLVYEVTPTLTAGLAYFRERVPASPERELVETDGEGVQFSLQGALTPLLSAQVGLGYTRQESPRVEEAGRRFRGLTADARLVQELGRSTSVAVGAQRTTQVSAFEGNAFYVSSGLRAEANASAPFELVLRGGAGVRWNDYRLPARALGVPRADRIVDWSVGAGRGLGRRAFLRADYTRERRRSNIESLRTTNWSFVAQLGLGWLDAAGRP
jgi:hypothetical protein